MQLLKLSLLGKVVNRGNVRISVGRQIIERVINLSYKVRGQLLVNPSVHEGIPHVAKKWSVHSNITVQWNMHDNRVWSVHFQLIVDPNLIYFLLTMIQLRNSLVNKQKIVMLSHLSLLLTSATVACKRHLGYFRLDTSYGDILHVVHIHRFLRKMSGGYSILFTF